jgi:hypothetical protein
MNGSTMFSGIPVIMVGDRQFTPQEVDNLFDPAKNKLPMATSANPMNWRQLMHDGALDITFPLKTFKAKNAVEGVRAIYQDEDDGPQFTFNLEDMSLWNLVKLLKIGDDQSMLLAAPKLINGFGTDLTKNGLPILIYHRESDPTNRGNVPNIGVSGTAVVGTAQSGSTNTTIKLAAGSSAVDDYYTGMYITITGGTGSGLTRKITGYVGSTKVATVSSAWDVTPDATTAYSIVPNGSDTQAVLLLNCMPDNDRKIGMKKPNQSIAVSLSAVAVSGSTLVTTPVYGSAPLDLTRISAAS